MARQLSGKNGVQISGGGSGGGGSGTTFVTTPEIRGGSRVAIGRPNEFSLSAMCLLSNARVLWFMVEATGGAIGGTFPAILEKDGKNTANVRITIPAGTQVGTTIRITVTARDNYGNESLPAEIAVTATAGYVSTPDLSAPLPSAEVSPASFYAITSAFAVLGEADTQIAAQYLVLTDDEKHEVLYDSGELTESTEFTKHTIVLGGAPSMRVPITVQARHKGELNGWSDYSAPIHCATSPERLVVVAIDSHISTSDFYKMRGFSSDGYTLPSKSMIYNLFEHKGAYVALTQGDLFWQIYTTTDLKNWEGPFTVDLVSNISNPSFCEFNGYLFLSNRTIWRSADLGKTWTRIAGGATTENTNFYGVVCSDEKYCYYTHAYLTSSDGISKLYRSSDGLIFTEKEIVKYSGADNSLRLKAVISGMNGALGDGLVILGSRNSITLYVSNDYGETFSEVTVLSGTFGEANYNNFKFLKFGEGVYCCYGGNLTKADDSGKTWMPPEDLKFSTISGPSIYDGKFSLWGASVGYKESTNATSWTSVGIRPQLSHMPSYKYFKSRSGEHIIYHANYFRSSDLTTWRSFEGMEVGLPVNLEWLDGCYAFGKYFRVGGTPNNGYISSSRDGVTWSIPGQSHGTAWRKIVFANGKLVISDENRWIRFSSDGETWSTLIDPLGTTAGVFGASNNGYFYWLNRTNASNSRYSTNLSTWTVMTVSQAVLNAPFDNAYGLMDGDDCCLLSCGGRSGSSYRYTPILVRGTSYVSISDTGGSTSVVGAYGNNVFVIGGGEGVEVYSKTPALMGSVRLGGNGTPRSLKFLHGVFYACLTDGKIQRSIDGLSWSAPVSGIREYSTNLSSVIMSNA